MNDATRDAIDAAATAQRDAMALLLWGDEGADVDGAFAAADEARDAMRDAA